MVYPYVSNNFILIGLLCRPWEAKSRRNYDIFNFNILWRRYL